MAGELLTSRANLIITQSQVSGNKAKVNGAGIYSQQATTNLEYSGVKNNSIAVKESASGGFDGGGIYAQNSALNLNGGTVSGNKAARGGGIYADSSTVSSTVTLEDSIITPIVQK